MKQFTKVPDKGDPSDILQQFPTINLQLLCCRYWWIKNWEFDELSYPYWRIYHNVNDVASIEFNGKRQYLSEDKIALIAPNTAYSSRLFDFDIPKSGYNLQGGRVIKEIPKDKLLQEQKVSHLFIHFNLGTIYDNVNPGIFMIKINEVYGDYLAQIKSGIIKNHVNFSVHTALVIRSLITALLGNIPKTQWGQPSNDPRVLDTISYINSNHTLSLTNTHLSQRIRLAPNSFNRLFTEELGISPQRYIKKSRISKACVMLHHTHLSIDQIAFQCGFADRYHFTRVFKQITNSSPAKYRSYLASNS